MTMTTLRSHEDFQRGCRRSEEVPGKQKQAAEGCNNPSASPPNPYLSLPQASLLQSSIPVLAAAMEAQKYVWEGAIPIQIHLHESQVTALPLPPAALVLAPRIGYLPLLAPLIKPYFSSTLPPGVDTIWFGYNGIPLKWYIPTGVLFDLLCPEPERPWNITVGSL
ncbi:hypothetical protein F3Y22_tig00110718pilonHSYRG00100 [Hibiscus syriacus]|uniref:Autophagy protein ATG5 UblA domain-containing protein n=1 Tax=Hibiscus syriacus TaxID=106335 RepID=A0A6A2ZVB7_HIBSY|nr:hypothetical protein F3Y22_tig00110718pilonHSYRG00100 [Hibiscus syriacus]